MKKIESIEAAKRFIGSLELHGKATRYLQDSLKPAIRLRTGEKLDPGHGKLSFFGGAPVLPHKINWPYALHQGNPPMIENKRAPLQLISQINLADLPFVANNPLPQDGLLITFFDGKNYFNETYKKYTISVRYYPLPPGSNYIVCQPPPVLEQYLRWDNGYDVIGPRALHQYEMHFDVVYTIPNELYLKPCCALLGFGEEACEIINTIQSVLYGVEIESDDDIPHQLLGHPHSIQNDPRYWSLEHFQRKLSVSFSDPDISLDHLRRCDEESASSILIGQYASEEKLDWCFHYGATYFLADSKKVEDNNFSDIYFELQST